jgi:hypothetical protein
MVPGAQIHKKITEKFERWLTLLYAGPYELFTNTIRRINQTNKPLPSDVIKKYKEFFQTDFQMNPEIVKSDNYWFTFFYVRTKNPRMSDLIHRWHQTSIFARNIATSFYITYIYGMLILFSCRHKIQSPHDFHICILLVFLFVLAIFFVIRFYHIFVCYYSKCLYRAFVFLHLFKGVDVSANAVGSDSHN